MHLIGLICTSHGNNMSTSLKLSVYRMAALCTNHWNFQWVSIFFFRMSNWNFLYILLELSVYNTDILFTCHGNYLCMSLELSVHITRTSCTSQRNDLYTMLKLSVHLIETFCTSH